MAKVPKRWFEDFFGSDYLIRYVHPETPAQVEAIDKILHLRKGGRILDLGCGAGRHSVGLAERGYRVTLGIAWPQWGGQRAHVGGRLRFDLLVNEMLPGRTRRAGQLVWSGGNGWVFVRGDRQDVARMGVLELVG